MNRGFRIASIVCVLAGSIGLISCGRKDASKIGAADNPQATEKYHCPMHPSIVSDKPGNCPICSMKLVPMGETKPVAKKTMYHSTMNPNEVSDTPGKDSMGMDMVPFEVGELSERTSAGLAAVSVTSEARQRMGLTTGVVERRALAREVRTSARILADETRLYRVTAKVEGWVDKLYTATTGQFVKQGDPLLTIYSPDLVSAQNEYLVAMRSGSTNLAASARRRLSLWDITDDQIDRLEKNGGEEKMLTL
jgi:Cu(I)/Ag(I) efflux system membrane fusion protein/cobalt-zinc-cadmium efflux system membrane fusion protein